MIRVSFVAWMSFALGGPAFAEDLAFTVVNDTSSTVVEFYVSPVDTDDWEENMVSSAVAPGDEVTATIADGRSVCDYDIRAVFEDGEEAESRDVNLCDLGTFTLHE
ncbi:MAG: hypothetical protein VYD57_01170 [Pseudomonadota bacterium]|nr:hypothetical protein [Pseudomonadota bacterium]